MSFVFMEHMISACKDDMPCNIFSKDDTCTVLIPSRAKAPFEMFSPYGIYSDFHAKHN